MEPLAYKKINGPLPVEWETEVFEKFELIPDFTLDQLKGYELRVLNPKHEDALPETNITPEELGLICTFLL